MTKKGKEVLRASDKITRSVDAVVAAVVGRAQDTRSKVVLSGLRKVLKKRTKIRTIMKGKHIEVRNLNRSEEANERVEAVEASVEEETTRNTETRANDIMTKRKNNIKRNKKIEAEKAAK